jgi:hypothetical protein
MDDINTQNQYMDYQPEERPGWWSRTMSGLKSGATMYTAGTALSKVPKMGWAGNLLKSFGKFDVQTAPIYSTTDPLADKLRNESTPTTTKGHAKKWLRNTGTEAGISAGLWGVGKGVALAGAATANPLVAGAGTALMGLGSMGMAYSWLSPTISTAIDVWLNRRNKAAQQQTTPIYPNGQPKMASYLKGNTTMNYVELVQMVKSAGAGAAEQDFRNKYETSYQKAMEGQGRVAKWEADHIWKPYVDARVNPLIADAKAMAERDQLIGGGAAGLAGAGLTYGGLGLIPGLKKRKLLRALAAVAGGVGAGVLAGNAVGRGSFNSRINSYSDPVAREAAYGRVSDRVNKSIGDIAKAEGYQGAVPKLKYGSGLRNIKKAAYTPVPQQQQPQENQNPKITAGRVAQVGLGGAGLGLATAGAGYLGGAAIGGGVNGIIAGQRLKKYMPGYGAKANFASNNLGAMSRRTERIANTMRYAGARGGVRGATIGALASIPVAAFVGNAYGKHLRNKWQQQDAQQAG